MITIILAGGEGKRLWPISKKNNPKQFIPFDFLGGKSLFQMAVERVKKHSKMIWVVAPSTSNQIYKAQKQAEAVIGKKKKESLVYIEDEGKGTLPAALKVLELIKPGSLVLIVSSDQVMDKASFEEAVFKGILKLKNKPDAKWIIFGSKQKHFEPGVGYFLTGGDGKVYQYKEKPQRHELEKGFFNYYINCGTFLFNWDEDLQNIFQEKLDEGKIAIDCVTEELVEKGNCYSQKIEGQWTDLGTFRRIFNYLGERGKQNNILNHSGQKIILKNVKGLQVITTPDIILITKKKNELKREEVDKYEQEIGIISQDPHHEKKEWGEYTVLKASWNEKTKELILNPGKSTSYQRHNYREESLLVVQGKIVVALLHDEKEGLQYKEISEGNSINIPKQTWHRIINPFEEPAKIIEYQKGLVFENNIERENK